MSIDMEDYTLHVILEQSKAANENKNMDAEKLSELLCKITDVLVIRSEKLEQLTGDHIQLCAYVDELLSFIDKQAIPNLLVLRDDYPQCLGICTAITDAKQLLLSNSYAKSISDIRAKAVMDFAGACRGAHLIGLVPAVLTIYDLYQTARNHVKDSYSQESIPWTGEYAEKLKQSNHDALINIIIDSPGGEI